MHELDDHALLRQYVGQNSEAAFATLVSRHVDKVYSVALRHTHNIHAAEEITQAVFVILAKKSGRLGSKVILSGWLYETARLTAVTFIRGEIRRARREQEAHVQTILNENESEPWPDIAPLLDHALARLSAADRHAIVLRYFDGRSLSEVGVLMGASEAAARKRVHRAVEKLRRFFTKRGVTLTATVLTAAISANSVQAAPAALAKTVTAVAIVKGVAASGSTLTLIEAALKIMAWTKAKTILTTIVVAGVLAAATTGVVGYKIVQTHRHTGSISIEGEIQPDGTVYARATGELINTANGTITPKDTWSMGPSPMDIQRMTDDDGQPLRFTKKPAENGRFDYSSFLNRPVLPGNKFAVKMEGAINGIGIGFIKSTGVPGVFEARDDGDLGIGYDTRRIYIYRLPPGAVLLDKSPNLKEATNGGRIEMRFDQVLPPQAKSAYHFRYRLPAPAI
jgi:RNA polymerase sigma factor (sigma-70 family)